LLQAAHGPPAAVWSTAIHLPIFALWVGTLLLLAPPRPRPH
jgi:hypothetical protein